MASPFLTLVNKHFGDEEIKKSHPLGPLVVELQHRLGAVEDSIPSSTAVSSLQAAGTMLVPFSFESGETGTIKVYLPEGGTITQIRAFVTQALAATDAGTITAQNSAGSAMAGGVLTIPASSSFGYQPTPATPTTNNVVVDGDFIELVTAKTTSGGGGFLQVEYTVS